MLYGITFISVEGIQCRFVYLMFYDQLKRTDLIDWIGLNVVWYNIYQCRGDPMSLCIMYVQYS